MTDHVNGHNPEPEWEEEGQHQNLAGLGVDLLYYRDLSEGVFHYILVMPGEGPVAERRLHRANPLECLILDGAKEQWEIAERAKAAKDDRAWVLHTYRGLRLIFPKLPEDPVLNARSN